MSKNRRNNHYHYAEKFDAKPRHSRSGKSVYVPFKAVIVALVFLLMFGLVTTTFGAYMSDNEPEYDPENPSMFINVRNIKASRDVAFTGAKADLADTGAQKNIHWQGRLYFLAPGGWNLTSSSVVQVAITRTTSASTSNHIEYIATMFCMGGRLWCGYLNANHSNWNQNEYIAIVANSSAKSSGTAKLNANTHYTGPQDYGVTNSSGVYLSAPTAATNGSSTNLSYNANRDTLMLKSQEADIYTNGSKDGTGGSVTMAGYYFKNDWTLANSADTSAGDYLKYDGALGTEMSISATAASGYRFAGFYDTSDNLLTTNSSYSYYITGAKKVVAKFIKTYTVTMNKYPSGYSGTVPKFTYNGSDYTSSATVDTGSTITLTSGVTTGYKCTWRKGSSTGTTISGNSLTITAATNIYACYSLSAPTINSYSYTSTITVGQTATLLKDVSSATGSSSGLKYSYTATAINSTANDTNITASVLADWIDSSTGAFTPTIPGEYRIRLSVYDTGKGLTSTTVSLNTATVTVKPAVPDKSKIVYTVEGYTDDFTENVTGVTYDRPAKVAINTESFRVTARLTETISGYSYSWSNTPAYNNLDDTTTAINNGRTKTSNTYIVSDLCTDSDSALIVSSDAHYAYVMNVYASYNGVSSDAQTVKFYYDVISDFLEIKYMSFTANTNDYQKIYAEDNGITDIVSTIRKGGTTFNTIFWFSRNNFSFETKEVWSALVSFTNDYGTFSPTPDDEDHRKADLVSSFDVSGFMQYTGPKWFRIYMNDTGTGKTASATRYIHTTVGTSSSVADRPIYYVDSVHTGFTNPYRVMAFYLLSGDNSTVHYQTGQKLSSRNDTYRFYIPANATTLTFAHVNELNYLLPTASNGNFSYALYTNNTVLMAWTNQIDLTDSANDNMTTFVADTATEDDNHIYIYSNTANSGNMTILSD